MPLYFARAVSAGTLIALTLGSASGCATEEKKLREAAHDLCDGFTWNPDATDEENAAKANGLLVEHGYSIEYGQSGRGAKEVSDVTDRAEDICPDTDFTPYLAALDDLDQAADQERYELLHSDDGPSSADAAAKAQRKERRERAQSDSSDGTVASELARMGYTRGDVIALGLIADDTGYGLSPGTPLPYDQAENFAYVIALSCQDLANGSTSVDALINDDVGQGAPPSQARRFWSYVTSRFCR